MQNKKKTIIISCLFKISQTGQVFENRKPFRTFQGKKPKILPYPKVHMHILVL